MAATVLVDRAKRRVALVIMTDDRRVVDIDLSPEDAAMIAEHLAAAFAQLSS